MRMGARVSMVWKSNGGFKVRCEKGEIVFGEEGGRV